MVNILTVDLEDWYMEAPRRRWGRFAPRIEADTEAVLDLLLRHRVRATFFVLGYIALKHPAVVRRIAAAGHEVAVHGMFHEPVYAMRPGRFRRDLLQCRRIVEAAAGAGVRGFRAPYFSVTRRSLWALRIVAECGLTYDSSIFPVWHFRYGIPAWPAGPTALNLDVRGGDRTLVEIPLSVVRLGGLPVPFCGGGYLRLLPVPMVMRAIRSLNRKGLPAVVYFHPWELDPGQPHVGGPAGFRLRHYVGLRAMRGKLERLLGEFPFVGAGAYVERAGPALPRIAVKGSRAGAVR